MCLVPRWSTLPTQLEQQADMKSIDQFIVAVAEEVLVVLRMLCRPLIILGPPERNAIRHLECPKGDNEKLDGRR